MCNACLAKHAPFQDGHGTPSSTLLSAWFAFLTSLAFEAASAAVYASQSPSGRLLSALNFSNCVTKLCANVLAVHDWPVP